MRDPLPESSLTNMPSPSAIVRGKQAFFNKESAALMDLLYQAQMIIIALQYTVSKIKNPGPLGDATFSLAQAFLLALLCFKPGVSRAVRIVHCILCLYSIGSAAYSLFLFFAHVDCTASGTVDYRCDIDSVIKMVSSAVMLTVKIGSKIVRNNEKRLEGNQSTTTPPASEIPVSPLVLPPDFPRVPRRFNSVHELTELEHRRQQPTNTAEAQHAQPSRFFKTVASEKKHPKRPSPPRLTMVASSSQRSLDCDPLHTRQITIGSSPVQQVAATAHPAVDRSSPAQPSEIMLSSEYDEADQEQAFEHPRPKK